MVWYDRKRVDAKGERNMELAMLGMIFLAGIILIVKGGDWFVDAAS